MPTKKELQDLNAALAAENAELRAQISALKVTHEVARSTRRPVLYTAFSRDEAFRVRNALDAKQAGGHPWAVQPVRVQRCGTETTMYAVF